jgi:hypothetical protein
MRKILLTTLVISAVLALYPSFFAEAAGPCYCERINPADRTKVADCSPAGVLAQCTSDSQKSCQLLQDAAACDQKVQAFNSQARGNNTVAPTTNETGGLTSKLIPSCALADNLDLKGDCGDITIFLYLMFKVIDYLFSIIGGVALLFFVYGGFVFILSEGNAEKVAHGKSIIVAAVLGIIIAFSGYALVRFVGTVIGLKSEYQLIE